MRVNAVVLSTDPVVFAVQTHARSPYVGDLEEIMLRIGSTRNALALVIQAWSIAAKSDENKACRRAAYVDISARYPNLRLVAICNEEIELQVFAGTSVERVVINQNAFVDETKFYPFEARKSFKAVYNAQMKVFKRHHLASRIDGLLLLYYGGAGDIEYFSTVKRALPTATFANGEPSKEGNNVFRFLSQKDVCAAYNSAQVGLALSPIEGAMYASIEYLLCGIPVVSTRNIGGRDVFAHSDYWITCDDDAEAVSRSVSELIARRISAEEIRKIAIQRMYEYRIKLFDLINSFYRARGYHGRDFANEFQIVFRDKFWKSNIELAQDTFPTLPT